MSPSLTPQDLVAYLYRETSISLSLDIETALCADPVLASDYDELVDAYHELPRVKFNAPTRAMQAVLYYSEKTALEQRV